MGVSLTLADYVALIGYFVVVIGIGIWVIDLDSYFRFYKNYKCNFSISIK